MNAIKRNSVTVKTVGKELARALEIKELLREHDDPTLVLDMIEGSTNLAESCCAVYEETLEDETLLAGVKATIADLKARQSRLEHSIETRRNVILMAMDRAGLDTIKSPLATLTRRPTPPKLIVADEAQIPARFWKPADPTLDRSAVKDALSAGEAVEGASLSNGGISLSIRTK